MKPIGLKEKAINYRKRGCSYNMISEKLGLAKSTLSNWLHEIDFIPNKKVLLRIERAKRNLVKGMYARRRKALEIRKQIKNKAKKEIGKLTKRELSHAGVTLYLAEENKTQRDVRITNSDPRVIKLITYWLREICKVRPNDFSAVVHLYPDNNVNKAISYWSRISKIPVSQFQKSQIDKRIKKSKIKIGKLPCGTLHLRVRKGGDLFYKISGWIEGLLENI